jgi:hypothetical protein
MLFFAQLTEKLKIQSDFIEEFHEFSFTSLEVTLISSFSFTSQPFIGINIALTHITNIIIIEI